MAVSDTLKGRVIDLIPVTTQDAQFTMDIRNDEKLTRYIPRIPTTLEKQQGWIERQRQDADDYFYIITRKDGEQVGTAAVYNVGIEPGLCEYGRYISYGSAIENVEAAVLSMEFAFGTLGMTRVMMNNDVRNEKIISFWKRFGAIYDGDYDYGEWTAARYILTPEVFEQCRVSIDKLIDKVAKL